MEIDLSEIITISVLLIGAYLSIYVYLQFAPNIIFTITPIWSELTPEIVVLKIEIENKSKVKLTTEKIVFKIISHKRSTLTKLTEWVDLDNAEEISKTTGIFYPGSILKIDRLYKCQTDEILQGIIRFEAKFSLIGQILGSIKGTKETWTNTFIIAK